MNNEPELPPAPDSTPTPKRRWLLLGVPLCLVLGWIEYQRALGGNDRSWVYTFEWPAFALCIAYMYFKIRRNEPIFKPYRPEDFEEDESSEQR
mgnify:CR=1 FL=1